MLMKTHSSFFMYTNSSFAINGLSKQYSNFFPYRKLKTQSLSCPCAFPPRTTRIKGFGNTFIAGSPVVFFIGESNLIAGYFTAFFHPGPIS